MKTIEELKSEYVASFQAWLNACAVLEKAMGSVAAGDWSAPHIEKILRDFFGGGEERPGQ